MAKKKQEPKIILEREYIVPLRKEWLKVPEYKRASKAVKALKQFIARHMKIYDRDLRKIKIEQILNNEIRFRGMRKPLCKIKVKAKKYDNDIVKVELVDIPTHVKFAKLREEKAKLDIKKKVKAPEEIKEEPKEEPKPEETEETKEKKEASKEESLAQAKMQAKEQRHTSKAKQVQVHRKALSR